MKSIFSKIIDGEIPSYKIYEDNDFFAFLDINPMSKGHTLLVPKIQIDYFFDLPDDLLQKMTVCSKKIAKAIQLATKCKRVGQMVIGFDVPHAHLHLIPLNSTADINISSPKLKLHTDEFELIKSQIITNLN